MRAAAIALALVGPAGLVAAGCVPDLPGDDTGPFPEQMQFDPNSTPPRVPEPTSLLINQTTGLIDFSLSGLDVPVDCTMPAPLSQAQCEFYQYLETLDGFPTTTPARAPASAALNPATVTAGTNVVVVAATSPLPTKVAGLTVGFATPSNYVTIRPMPSWNIGTTYLAAVRGYATGVRAASGVEVAASPTMSLLKAEEPLTCGATSPAELDPSCTGFALVSSSIPDDDARARATVFQLEAIRSALNTRGAYTAMAAIGGIPKAELAVLWTFPIHSNSVAELDPSAGLVPMVTAPNEIRVAVQGPVDPTTVTPFTFGVGYGSVVLVDLTNLLGGNLPGGFPAVTATFTDGNIVITGAAPFTAGHQLGIFMLRDDDAPPPGIKDPMGRPLVPSPVSKLLTLSGTLVDTAGHSTVSGVADTDAAMLEAGRAQLAMFFDSPGAAIAGIKRSTLVYTFAFQFGVAP